MGNIELPKGIVGLDEHPHQKEYLVNYVWTPTGLIRNYGIEAHADGVGPCYGVVHWQANNKTYMVSGNALLRVNEDGTTANLGTVSGTTKCFFSQGQVYLVIGRIGGAAYTLSTSETLAAISDPEYLPSVGADFIDGRHVFIPADGSPAFYSDVDNAGSIDPLSFFDAEELPDQNKAVINISNQLYILGADSAEVFRVNVDPDAVFTRREGARVDTGYLSCLVRYKGTFAFIGRDRGESFQIFVMDAGRAVPISSPAIDELLESYTEDQLKSADAVRYKLKGYECLAFTINDRTIVFCEGNWSYQSSGTELSKWRVYGIAHNGNRYIVGDRDTKKIGCLSSTAQEYGEDVFSEIQTFIRSEKGGFFKIGKIEPSINSGVCDTTESIGLSISKDGKAYSGFNYREIGEKGEYRRRIRWQPPGGIGAFESFCGIKIKTTAPDKLSLDFLSFE